MWTVETIRNTISTDQIPFEKNNYQNKKCVNRGVNLKYTRFLASQKLSLSRHGLGFFNWFVFLKSLEVTLPACFSTLPNGPDEYIRCLKVPCGRYARLTQYKLHVVWTRGLKIGTKHDDRPYQICGASTESGILDSLCEVVLSDQQLLRTKTSCGS